MDLAPGLVGLNRDIAACTRCPRLRAFALEAAGKKAAFRNQRYWSRPVAGFGDPSARLVVIGLAPGAHGANRTGRPFTGDAAGQWLFDALYTHGFCNHPDSQDAQDGLILNDAYITNAIRCVPPQDRPKRAELEACRPFLEAEMAHLDRAIVYLTLGRTVFERFSPIARSLGMEPGRALFAHGAVRHLGQGRRWVASYHPSQRNTRTGRLTGAMWEEIFDTIQNLLEEG